MSWIVDFMLHINSSLNAAVRSAESLSPIELITEKFPDRVRPPLESRPNILSAGIHSGSITCAICTKLSEGISLTLRCSSYWILESLCILRRSFQSNKHPTHALTPSPCIVLVADQLAFMTIAHFRREICEPPGLLQELHGRR